MADQSISHNLLENLLKRRTERNPDGMEVVKWLDKPNGGVTAYLRLDAVIKYLNQFEANQNKEVNNND